MAAPGFDRSLFHSSPEELDLHEACMALRRVLDQASLSREARRVLESALAVLESRTR